MRYGGRSLPQYTISTKVNGPKMRVFCRYFFFSFFCALIILRSIIYYEENYVQSIISRMCRRCFGRFFPYRIRIGQIGYRLHRNRIGCAVSVWIRVGYDMYPCNCAYRIRCIYAYMRSVQIRLSCRVHSCRN